MPGGVSAGFGNNNLDAVNKLREHWHKGQNAVVIDDHVSMTNSDFHLRLSIEIRFGSINYDLVSGYQSLYPYIK